MEKGCSLPWKRFDILTEDHGRAAVSLFGRVTRGGDVVGDCVARGDVVFGISGVAGGGCEVGPSCFWMDA